jgi:hypothetical protein
MLVTYKNSFFQIKYLPFRSIFVKKKKYDVPSCTDISWYLKYCTWKQVRHQIVPIKVVLMEFLSKSEFLLMLLLTTKVLAQIRTN